MLWGRYEVGEWRLNHMSCSILYILTGLTNCAIYNTEINECKSMLSFFSSLHWVECSHRINAVFL